MSDYSDRYCKHGTYLGTPYRCSKCREDLENAKKRPLSDELRLEIYEAGYCDGAYKCKLGKTDIMDHYNEWVAAGCPPAPENA